MPSNSLSLHRIETISPTGFTTKQRSKIEIQLNTRIRDIGVDERSTSILAFVETQNYAELLRSEGILTGDVLQAESMANLQLKALESQFEGRVRIISTITMARFISRLVKNAPHHANNIERYLGLGYDRNKIIRFIANLRGHDDSCHLLADDDVRYTSREIRLVAGRFREHRRNGDVVGLLSGRYLPETVYERFQAEDVDQDDWEIAVNGFSTRVIQLVDWDKMIQLIRKRGYTNGELLPVFSNLDAPMDIRLVAKFLNQLHKTGVCPMTAPVSGCLSTGEPLVGLRSNFDYTMYADDGLLVEQARAINRELIAEQIPNVHCPQSRYSSRPNLGHALWSIRTYLNKRLWTGAVAKQLFQSMEYQSLLESKADDQDLNTLWTRGVDSLREFVHFASSFDTTLLGCWANGWEQHRKEFSDMGFIDNEVAPNGMKVELNQLPERLPDRPKTGSLADSLKIVVENVATTASKSYDDFWTAVRETAIEMELSEFDLPQNVRVSRARK